MQTRDEVMTKVAEHGRKDHGMQTIPAEVAAKVKRRCTRNSGLLSGQQTRTVLDSLGALGYYRLHRCQRKCLLSFLNFRLDLISCYTGLENYRHVMGNQVGDFRKGTNGSK